ncbi:class I adenylate-forming enzyme family protein [Parafrankia discariae]|uniref:class I adenylate-forming enzyme family protein n=1 Tax=Parafrankia discariae TaxID=365528 RepID=UPI00036C780B|nr:AMP-binding protein [Parafrankia discariae]
MTASTPAAVPSGTSLGRLAELSIERTGGTGPLIFEGQRWTAGQLAARARRLAGGLRSAGLAPGERVAVCMANCPEVGITYQATWRAGAAVTPVLFLLGDTDLRHVLADSGASFVVTTPDLLGRVHAAARGLPTLRAVVLAERPDRAPEPAGHDEPAGRDGPPVLLFAELEAAAESALVDVDPSDMAALLYTGGTTGRARGVVLSHDNVSAAAWAVHSTRLGEGLPGLLPLPMSHVYGMTVSVMATYAETPATAVLMRWFEPVRFLELAVEHRVAQTAVVPAMARMILDQDLDGYDLSALRQVVSGSSALPRELADEWARRLPGVELVEGYGCTEASAIVTVMPPGRARLGSVGRPAPGVELRIEPLTDTDTGGDTDGDHDGADDSPVGEICVRGPGVMLGYWRDPAATARTVRAGWLHTGDVGRLDRDGFLHLVDRLKDLIIRGGFNIYPRDVEDALREHPAVAEVAVVGRPDRRLGEEIVAFVQLGPGAAVPAEELVRFGRERLGPLRYPREVRIVPEIPRTGMLKTDRAALRTTLTRPAAPTPPADRGSAARRGGPVGPAPRVWS